MSDSHPDPRLDDILATCLDDVLSGRKTLPECLAAYPNDAAELKPLLQMAILTARLKAPEMRASSVDALEVRLRAQMAGTTAHPPMPRQKRAASLSRIPFGLSRLAAVILVALLLAFGGGGGLVAASANTVPGDTLYSVKRLWEEIILALAQLLGQGDDARARVAYARLSELEILDSEGRLNESALADLYASIYELTQHVDAGNQTAILAFMGQVRDALSRVSPAANAEGVYMDLLNMTAQSVATGQIPAPSNALPPSELQLTATFTPTASPSPTVTGTLAPTLTATPSPTSTDTLTPAPSATPTITPTFTPRIPATATQTPTFTPSPTLTPSATPTPTATWTPLPLPGVPQITPAATLPSSGPIVTDTPLPRLTANPTDFVRQTQQSVYLTQTAEAP